MLFHKAGIYLCLTLVTVWISCTTVDGDKVRKNQEFTLRIIGMSLVPFPSGLGLGYRLSETQTLEVEGSADLLTLNSYTAAFLKQHWTEGFYGNIGLSNSRSIMRNTEPYRKGLHLSLGKETYYGNSFFTGFEVINADIGAVTDDGVVKMKGGGGNLLRFFVGWGL